MRVLLPALLSLLLPAFNTDAAFTMRLGGVRAQLEAAGGTLLHRDTAICNGAESGMHVFGFDSAPSAVISEIRAARRLPTGRRGEGAWISFSEGRRRFNLFVLPGRVPTECSVWLIDSPITHRTSPPPIDFDPCPDGDLDFWISLSSGRALLLSYSSPRLPAELLERAGTVLESIGWSVLLHSPHQLALGRDGRAGFAVAANDGRLTLILQGNR